MRCPDCLKKHGPSKNGLNYIFTCAVCGKRLDEATESRAPSGQMNCLVSCFGPGRLEELSRLRGLITTLRNINNGSHLIEKLKECIQVAEELERHDTSKPRASFMEYLTAKAHGDNIN